MPLAVMFLVAILPLGTQSPLTPTQFAEQAPSATSAQPVPDKQGQEETPSQEAPPAKTKPTAASPAPAQEPSAGAIAPAKTQPATAKRSRRRKKAASSNCSPAPAPAAGTASGSNAPSNPPADPSAGANSAQSSGTAATPTNCPPPKIIVRQGGTTEPSIQLAGGPPTDHAAQLRNIVNQLLGATEVNLKKISGQQLSSDQQGTVAQIHAFMQQSRDAATAGDLERARTLGWKAELLSEDLIKAPK